jgi:hypothetical protein
MEATTYVPLGDKWKDDEDIKCCKKEPPGTTPGCDCCYDNWVIELQDVGKKYKSVNEQAIQFNDQYKFVASQRDKLKSWKDDLDKTDDLIRTLCGQFDIVSTQASKICINAEKTVEAIEYLFCMVRELFEQIDLLVVTYNQIDNCIKCLNDSQLPEDSGIRKCLKNYWDKLVILVNAKTDVIKAVMNAISLAELLHEDICSDYGLVKIISEWKGYLHCGEKCDGGTPPKPDPCADKDKGDGTSSAESCPLIPILTLPVCKDSHYIWVKGQYDKDVTEAGVLHDKWVEANKKKEALAACQASLTDAIKAVDPQEICK